MTVKIAIVEDEAASAQLLEECLLRYRTEAGAEMMITRFSNAEELLRDYRGEFDLLFMDVDMPGINGIDASRRLREMDSRVVLIFVTNLAQYAIYGYEVDALDYILKPVNYYALKLKLRKALEVVRSRAPALMMLPCEGGVRYLNSTEICYVEVQGHELIYHTASGERLRTSGALKQAEAKLGGGFFRCNYCYLVNFSYVTKVSGNLVTVGGEELQISRNRRKAFLQQLSRFYGKGG